MVLKSTPSASYDWKNIRNKSLSDKPLQWDQDKISEVLIFSSVSVMVMESLLLPLVELSRSMIVGWGHFPGEIKILVGSLSGSECAAGVAVKVSASEDDLHLFDPLCMWLSQYFFWGIASLLHCHLLPSVLLHLSGSSAMKPSCLQTLLQLTTSVTKNQIMYIIFFITFLFRSKYELIPYFFCEL